MARAIQPGQVTPADELRTLLDVNEKRAANLRGRDPAAVELLHDLDRIAALWPALEAQGVDLRPESGRWETLQASVQRQARPIVRQVQRAGGFPAARARFQSADTPAWWWRLDEQVRAADRRRIVRAVGVAAALLAAVVGLNLLLRALFPVDPHLRAALDAMMAGESKIAQQGDFLGAAEDFRRATEATPEDAETWLRLGIALQKLGDTAGAEAAFQRGQSLFASEAELRIARAAIYLAFDLSSEAEADLQVAAHLAPEEPLIYFYQANIFEARQQYDLALAALERADALANEQGEAQLVAVLRYRMGMVMQQAQNFAAVPTAQTP